jgi:hypothetical protein
LAASQQAMTAAAKAQQAAAQAAARETAVAAQEDDLAERKAAVAAQAVDLEERRAVVARQKNDLEERRTAMAAQENDVTARKAAVSAEEQELAERKAAVAARDVDLAKRAIAVHQKSREADMVIRLADLAARGEIEITRSGGGPAQATATGAAPSTAAQKLVKDATGKGGMIARALDAFARLRERLQRKAQDALREREEDLAQGVAKLREAQDIIAEAAQSLPSSALTRIKASASGIASRLVSLEIQVAKARRSLTDREK